MGGEAEGSGVLNSFFSITKAHCNSPFSQVLLTLVSFWSQYFTIYPIVSTYLNAVHTSENSSSWIYPPQYHSDALYLLAKQMPYLEGERPQPREET